MLTFLGQRVIDLESGSAESDEDNPAWELEAARRLIDLVLYELMELGREDIARIEDRADG